MGIFPVGKSHDSRPTGRLIATKWKHEHLRWIVISAILTFAVIVMFHALLQDASAKRVTVVDDGASANYRTWSAQVADFLSEQGINIGPFDRISVSLAAPLGKSEHIVIERAKQILIQADGQQRVKYTTESTVGDALAALNIRVDNDDRVIPSLHDPIQEGDSIRVVRVHVETIESEHPIAYTVVKQKDNNLDLGKEKVVKTGKEGLLVKKMERVFEDGMLVREEMLEEVVVRPAVQQVVSVGSKKPAPATLLASADNVSATGSDAQVQRTGHLIQASARKRHVNSLYRWTGIDRQKERRPRLRHYVQRHESPGRANDCSRSRRHSIGLVGLHRGHRVPPGRGYRQRGEGQKNRYLLRKRELRQKIRTEKRLYCLRDRSG